jgi:hypothetical protein
MVLPRTQQLPIASSRAHSSQVVSFNSRVRRAQTRPTNSVLDFCALLTSLSPWLRDNRLSYSKNFPKISVFVSLLAGEFLFLCSGGEGKEMFNIPSFLIPLDSLLTFEIF